jgi:methyl-accepting chemotaxis protein
MTIFNKLKISIFDSERSEQVAQKHTQMQFPQQYISALLVKSATSILLTDTEHKIVYANQAAKSFFRDCLHDIKLQVPGFDPNNVEGQAISSLFPDIANLVDRPPSVHKLASGYFSVNVQLLSDSADEKEGYFIELTDVSELNNKSAILDAMNRSQAVIEFTPDGTILTANNNFMTAMGYDLSEIVGKHHSMFAPDSIKNSEEYKTFWARLKAGEFFSTEARRIKKGGQEIWLSASYNPVFDDAGKVYKVIKFATDITAQKLINNDYAGQISAIRKSQAVIEFNMDGTIIDANDAFLATTGYRLDEIRGQHHRIFGKADYIASAEYKKFWADLNEGKFLSDEIERVAKDGSTLWLQASYNPIFDSNGVPFKVVKYAANVTERKRLVDELQGVLLKLGQCDLSASINIERESPYYVVGESMNEFIVNFRAILNQINDSAVNTENFANEIAASTVDLASRTEQQASGLQKTAATMEELATTISQSASNAEQANSLAQSASDVATSGGELILEVVENMGSITESANKISDIIGVIDGIAFQTNILALNAAVEAARAGEQGRGFAVVASEVRTLAQRSANAAKDIKTLISDSVEKVQSGNTLVNDSGETMKKIVASIKQVTTIMAEINLASSEQAQSISDVSATVRDMDSTTQQNTAMVEEASASSENMKTQAHNLREMVGRFTLN